MKKSEQKDRKIVIGIVILSVAIVVMILLNVVISLQENNKNNQQTNQTTEGQQIDEELQKLQSMEEYDRIKYYFNKYISYIENGKYEEAYNLLYPDFKTTYFSTLESYITYVKQKYPSIMSVEYSDVARLGKYYVLDIKFVDIINVTETETPGFTQKVILYENNWNDFVISFQAE